MIVKTECAVKLTPVNEDYSMEHRCANQLQYLKQCENKILFVISRRYAQVFYLPKDDIKVLFLSDGQGVLIKLSF